MILALSVIVKTLLILITGNLFASTSLGARGQGLRPAKFRPFPAGHGECDGFVAADGSFHRPARLSGVPSGKRRMDFRVWIAFTGIMIGFGAAVRAAFGG